MPGRFGRTWRRVRAARARDVVRAARHAMLFVVACVHAAKYLPTVRRAVPWYIWPLLAVASAVKALPVDFGVDEALFTLAFALIAWRRPGLLRALYREAQAGKPAPCRCPRHA
ncbi:MAG TPA: hypothetical protein VGH53_23915 [Streptosporangiaceae bacterium]|jgi:hypothetical protein